MRTSEENRKYQRAWREKNKERINEQRRKWLLENPGKRKEAQARYRKGATPEKLRKYILDNYEWYIFNSCRTRARKLGVEFTLREEDIIIPEYCPYLGVKLTRIQGYGRQDFNPSLDKINPALGYTPGNVEIISDMVNRMKNSATQEQLETFALAILRRKNDSKRSN